MTYTEYWHLKRETTTTTSNGLTGSYCWTNVDSDKGRTASTHREFSFTFVMSPKKTLDILLRHKLVKKLRRIHTQKLGGDWDQCAEPVTWVSKHVSECWKSFESRTIPTAFKTNTCVTKNNLTQIPNRVWALTILKYCRFFAAWSGLLLRQVLGTVTPCWWAGLRSSMLGTLSEAVPQHVFWNHVVQLCNSRVVLIKWFQHVSTEHLAVGGTVLSPYFDWNVSVRNHNDTKWLICTNGRVYLET